MAFRKLRHLKDLLHALVAATAQYTELAAPQLCTLECDQTYLLKMESSLAASCAMSVMPGVRQLSKADCVCKERFGWALVLHHTLSEQSCRDPVGATGVVVQRYGITSCRRHQEHRMR
jgi:hypothetical protein